MRDRALLAAILTLGFLLRTTRLSWGLPAYDLPDGLIRFVRPAARLAGTGELVPPDLVHPPLLTFVLGALYHGWSVVRGEAVPAATAPLAALADLVLLGRGACALVATASIGVLWALARRLLGGRVALLAASVFAFCPLHVLESHRVNPDGLAILLGLVAARLAVAARDRQRAGLLAASFAVCGLAAAAKYTGVIAAAVPAWVALGWPASSAARLGFVAGGGVLAAAVFALATWPSLADWSAFTGALGAIGGAAYGVTQPGLDLHGQGWVYVRWVYGAVVALPYAMGWPAYLAGLVGVGLLLRRDRRAGGVVLAGLLPYFLLQGASPVVVARYYQPLVPWLAIAAGVALDGAGRARWRVPAATVVLGYTALLAGSQCARLGLGPQRAVGSLVAARATVAEAAGTPVVVGYPDPFAFAYDAARAELTRPGVRLVFFPKRYANVRTEPDETPADAELLDADRAWLAETGVTTIVLPSWVENATRRERPDGFAGRFYDRLGDGRLGFRLAADFRSHFLTERLYVWADPMLDTHWETGIASYKVFLRDPPS